MAGQLLEIGFSLSCKFFWMNAFLVRGIEEARRKELAQRLRRGEIHASLLNPRRVSLNASDRGNNPV